MASRWDQNRAFMVRCFFLATLLQFAVAVGLSWLLAWINGPPAIRSKVELPVAFQVGTVCLALGSWLLHQALHAVRMERQQRFRRRLLQALAMAVIFTGVQSYGLWAFARGVAVHDWQQTEVNAFVFVFAALHCMHFLVAQSVLLWVTLCALNDRYDHEYYWGVVFAAWCWHVLGLVWLAILCVFAIVV